MTDRELAVFLSRNPTYAKRLRELKNDVDRHHALYNKEKKKFQTIVESQYADFKPNVKRDIMKSLLQDPRILELKALIEKAEARIKEYRLEIKRMFNV